jgi:acetyl esterase/lipase
MDPSLMRRTAQEMAVVSLAFAALAGSPFPLLAAQQAAGRQAEPSEASSAAPTSNRSEYSYGADPLQKLDFWHATAKPSAPLIVFVHGGGWKRGDKRNATGAQKVEHLTKAGYAFASINYRLVPSANVEQQAADVSAAVAWLRCHAGQLGIDTSRIVLMGHSAGAHLVALVGTDPQYLAAAGLSLSDLLGVITLDGAAYDVARQIADSGRLMRATYAEAFGSDPVRQRALSPALQAAATKAPAFLILHIDRADGRAQSEALAKALVQAGTPAEVHGVSGTGLLGHMEINRSLGSADYASTAMVDDWLRKLLRAK